MSELLSVPAIPKNLFEALSNTPLAMTTWQNITPIARRDWISWIESAKQEATQNIRIEKTCSKLAAGKKRPCCYALVPMILYKALDANPVAKSQWKLLTPNERRDLVQWIESAMPPESRQSHIKKACTMLATGLKLDIKNLV